ncbi:PD-(D/E)XK nuclease domain-containing protein [Chloroflexi bacterium TSY]|nr:PD-(D/E)XK nuclease domain-containing protein [Chloroflexi bacterium TSY]
MIGIETEAEVVTNDGRIDAVIELPDHIFIFEFNLDGTVDEALAQIRKKEYFQKYWLKRKSIQCVGVNFDTKSRTISAWDIEEIDPAL